MSVRKMPSKRQIKTHWAEKLVYWEKFDSVEEVWEADYCWACGMLENTERAHIQSRWRGGDDNVENLHLLCPDCHKASEFLDGDVYIVWLLHRDYWGRILEGTPGSEIAKLLKLALAQPVDNPVDNFMEGK